MPIVAALPAIASTALSVGASIYGANKQSEAAQAAARASKKATDASLQLQRDIYTQNRADQEPWRQAGMGALNRLQDPSAFEASPDYAFRLSEGLKGVTQNRAVAGLLNSGSALRGLNDYAQSTAANEYGAWWNRQSGLAGIGQAANAQNAQSGSSYANNSQNALMQNAQTQGQSSYMQGQAAAQMGGQVAGALGWGLQNIGGAGGAGAANASPALGHTVAKGYGFRNPLMVN